MEGNDSIKMATSILDYIFRELAVSYMGRNDLAHVQPDDLKPDTVGRGSEDDSPVRVTKVASQGYLRSNFLVLNGGKSGTGAEAGEATMSATTTGIPVVTQTVAIQPDNIGGNQVAMMREAKMKGYEGDTCEDCGNFTLVRNGTCMKCLTCGATSGCS